MNVNVLTVVRGMGIVRLVWSTIRKTVPAQTAEKPGMKAKRNN